MTAKTQTKGAAVYRRVSTYSQEEGTSLKEQRERTIAQAKALGLDVVKEYEDSDISGGTPLSERPAGAQMMQDAEAGLFSTLIVSKLDRFSRSLANGAADLEKLEEWGITVAFIDLGLRTDTAAGKMALQVLLIFAQFEKERIRERNASGQWQTALAEKWSGGQVPYGYQVAEDGTIEVEPDEAKVIEAAYSLRAEGKSMTQVADALSAMGFKPRQKVDRDATSERRRKDPDAGPVYRASSFHASSVQKYISPEAIHYMGAGINREVPVPETGPCEVEQCIRDHEKAEAKRERKAAKEGHKFKPKKMHQTHQTFTWEAPAIVTPKLWQQAVSMADSFTAVANAGQQKWAYGLAGRVFHLETDGTTSTMYGHTRYGTKKGGSLIKKGTGKDTVYVEVGAGNGTHEAVRQYRCTSARKRAGEPPTCTGLGEAYGQRLSAAHADRLEGAALLFMLQTLENHERLEQYLKTASQTLVEEGADPDSVAALETSLERARRKRTIQADQYAEGILTNEEWQDRKAKTEAQIEAIQARLEAAKSARGWREQIQASVADLLGAQVKWTAEGEAEVSELDDVANFTGAQKAHELAREATAAVTPGAYGRTQTLHPDTIAEVSRLAALLGFSVTLSQRGDWPEGTNDRYVTQNPGQWPELAYTFHPEGALQAPTGSNSTASALGRLPSVTVSADYEGAAVLVSAHAPDGTAIEVAA